MNNLQKIALVIPTYERQNFALRSMFFWSDKGIKLYIVDGSENPISKDKLEGLSENIKYFHFPKNFSERLFFISKLITEEYVSILGDDEFFVPSALSSCVNFLEKNKDYVTCTGRAMRFYLSKKKEVVYGAFVYPKMANYDVSQDSPLDRLRYHMYNYTPTIVYGISRIEQWKIAIEAYKSQEFPIFAQGELQIEMLLSFAGKSIVLPELMWMRSLGETMPIRGTEPSLDVSKKFSVFWQGGENLNLKNQFVRIMAKFYNLIYKDTNINYEDAVNIGSNSYCQYYKESQTLSKKNDFFMMRIWNKNKMYVPEFLKYCIKKIFSSHKDIKLLNCAILLMKTGVKVDLKEIINFENIIIEFHQKLHNDN